jgi:pyroglutamyl-peptidase
VRPGAVCRSLLGCLGAVALSLASTTQAADNTAGTAHPGAAGSVPVCLLTGFEPFGGAKTNPSWEIAKALNGQTIAGYRVVSVELPVVYDEIAKPLAAALKTHTPRLVICIGQGGGLIEIEQIARNGYHPTRPRDNKGQPPPRDRILPDGPAQVPTGLPVERILAALKSAGIGAQASSDAGGYLCNECFYRLMTFGEKDGASGILARGFVHVPTFGAPSPEGGVYTAEKLISAVKLMVEATAQNVAGQR